MIIGACVMPHPPMAVKEIGKGSEKSISATLASYDECARFIASLKPETIVVTSPHAVMYRDYFNVSAGKRAYGDFGNFGARQVAFEVSYDTAFVKTLDELCRKDGFPGGTSYDRDKELDHGTMVPLYFINKRYKDYRLVRIGLSGFSLTNHYELGQYIAACAASLNKRVFLLASGDLSHCQKEDGPYGYKPEGPAYDKRIMKTLGSGAFDELFSYSEDFLEKAMECGHRSFAIMAGALDGLEVRAHELSHEDVTGVGYGFVYYEIIGRDPSRRFLEKYKTGEKERISAKDGDPYVKLARASIEAWVKERRVISLSQDAPDSLSTDKAGAFVSIHEFGSLRGCIGTVEAVRDCLGNEIIYNAISACAKDPRFAPITLAELPFLEISVDVLSKAERILDRALLDVKKYGVICSLPDGRKGLLLPAIEGVDTVDEQIAIACQKGGMDPDDKRLILERFEVVRHV